MGKNEKQIKAVCCLVHGGSHVVHEWTVYSKCGSIGK